MRIFAILAISFWLIACGHSHTLIVQCECCTAGDQPIPEIRLVQDTAAYDTRRHELQTSFHFQWDAPLQEERLVLVEILESGQWSSEEPQRYLLAFPAGSFRSDQMYVDLYPRTDATDAYVIKILEASARLELPLPRYVDYLAYTKGTDTVSPPGHEQRESVLLLKEHPFKPYKVGSPSVLRFKYEAQPSQ